MKEKYYRHFALAGYSIAVASLVSSFIVYAIGKGMSNISADTWIICVGFGLAAILIDLSMWCAFFGKPDHTPICANVPDRPYKRPYKKRYPKTNKKPLLG